MNKLLILFITVLLLASCQSKTIDLPDFDELAWQQDIDGCNGTREKMREQLIKVKSELKGLNGNGIVEVLGKPNRKNLADRNQKHFVYNISCPSDSTSSTLSIRFNAVGLAYEVVVY